ncbi:MAG TPA: FHA domain-containing protein [Gemmatimonadaceae bacterium]|nr:FHA domain-containing protein [Gemmatimonadaceae bacterium]
MPYIAIGSRQHELRAGENTLGSDGSDVVIPAMPRGTQAIVVLGPRGATIRRTGTVRVMLDGQEVSAAPIAVPHGAKIDIGRAHLVYGDERLSGGTDFVTSVSDDSASVDSNTPATPGARTGGRIVGLADRHTYTIPDAGLSIGRDPGCDVVLGIPGVSRRHADIVAGSLGYLIKDSSMNGVYVNGARVSQARWLGVGDVIRIGTEEYRFEADVDGSTPGTAQLGATGFVASVPSRPASGSPHTPLPSLRMEDGALAMIELMNGGALRGRRVPITKSLVRVGRGPHNDVVVPDESVSGIHATIERRENEWFILDASSRNGTFVRSERIEKETKLQGPTVLQFGNVQAMFIPRRSG